MNNQQQLLALEGVNVYYGAIWAIKGIDLTVNEGEIVSLIGANGAGKSTTLRAISGIVKVSSGRILFQGEDITRIPAHEIVKLGIAQVPEGRRVFANLTVLENLEQKQEESFWKVRLRNSLSVTK